MRSNTVLVLCTLICVTTCQVNSVKENLIQVMIGVVQGLSEEAHFDVRSIESCVNTSYVALQDFGKSVFLIQASSFKNGLRQLGQALTVIPDALTQCLGHQDEMIQVAQMLESLITQLKHPITLSFSIGSSLILNGVEIFGEVVTAADDWKNGNYRDFGRQEGKILFQLLMKPQNLQAVSLQTREDPQLIATDVFLGLLMGFAFEGGVKPQDLMKCIVSTPSETTAYLIEAVNALEKEHAYHTIGGLKMLGLGLKQLPIALENCASAGTVEILVLIKNLVLTIEELQNPLEYSFHVGKDIILNGVNIRRQITEAVVNWKDEYYIGFGIQIGGALYDMFIGHINVEQ